LRLIPSGQASGVGGPWNDAVDVLKTTVRLKRLVPVAELLLRRIVEAPPHDLDLVRRGKFREHGLQEIAREQVLDDDVGEGRAVT
jgi:hypothetical protein